MLSGFRNNSPLTEHLPFELTAGRACNQHIPNCVLVADSPADMQTGSYPSPDYRVSFPSRRREAADGGADTDCGFILDERNGVDWSVDTGHIPHHLGSTVVLLFAVRHGTALPGELAAGFRVQTVGQHCHDSAVDFRQSRLIQVAIL